MNNNKMELRSHVMDDALAKAPLSGIGNRRKRHVTKNRFLHPLVTLGSKDGKSFRLGKWKNGHRHNPASR